MAEEFYENRDEFTKLAEDMEANPDRYGGSSLKDFRKEVISNLRNLEYDDFANENFATPKMQMIEDFRKLKRDDVAQRVMNGDFDQ